MPEGYEAPGARDGRLGDQDQARRRRGTSSEGLGASREGRGRAVDREGLGLAPRKKRGQRPGAGRPGPRSRRDLSEGQAAPETQAPVVPETEAPVVPETEALAVPAMEVPVVEPETQAEVTPEATPDATSQAEADS